MIETLISAVFIYFLGVVAGYLLKRWLVNRTHSSGTIYVTKMADEKTLYSLELDDYPESLIFKKEVVFRVDASEQGPIRE